MDSKGVANVKPLTDILSRPIYFQILKQITKGNKTSTSISKELNMAQSGIYERLKKMKDANLLKTDEKNFEINYDFLVIFVISSLPKKLVFETKSVKNTIKGELKEQKSFYNLLEFLFAVQRKI